MRHATLLSDPLRALLVALLFLRLRDNLPRSMATQAGQLCLDNSHHRTPKSRSNKTSRSRDKFFRLIQPMRHHGSNRFHRQWQLLQCPRPPLRGRHRWGTTSISKEACRYQLLDTQPLRSSNRSNLDIFLSSSRSPDTLRSSSNPGIPRNNSSLDTLHNSLVTRRNSLSQATRLSRCRMALHRLRLAILPSNSLRLGMPHRTSTSIRPSSRRPAIPPRRLQDTLRRKASLRHRNNRPAILRRTSSRTRRPSSRTTLQQGSTRPRSSKRMGMHRRQGSTHLRNRTRIRRRTMEDTRPMDTDRAA
jgi:hypothetical protein